MPRKGKRVRVSKGIYRDSGGYEVRVVVGGTPYSERMPPDATLPELKAKHAALTAKGRTETPRAVKDTLRADAPKYLRLIAHLATVDDRADHLQAWIALYGEVYRHRLTREDVLAARNVWLTQGRTDHAPGEKRIRVRNTPLSPKTINHYCDTLRHLYHVLDGKRAPTPCDEVPHLPEHRAPIQRITDALMLRVDAELQARERGRVLRAAKTRARFRVIVSTGKRPIEVMRAQPEDVDFEARVWVPRDAKGGFTPGLYLNDDQLAAWTLFATADAWGQFNLGAFVRTIRAAGWPRHLRLYQARHSTWIAASERGADLADISAGAGHRDLRLTRKMYVPVLNSRMQALSERLDGRFSGFPVVPESVPAVKRKRTQK